MNFYSTSADRSRGFIAGPVREITNARLNGKLRGGFLATAEKHCAAQAEYGRLAAQAYSPSDAISQALICRNGIEKGSRSIPRWGHCRRRPAIVSQSRLPDIAAHWGVSRNVSSGTREAARRR